MTSKGFGDPINPLLVSVRSGAMFSMPGMMDTILNLGLNDKTVNGVIKKPKIPDSHGIHIEDLFKCFRMSF